MGNPNKDLPLFDLNCYFFTIHEVVKTNTPDYYPSNVMIPKGSVFYSANNVECSITMNDHHLGINLHVVENKIVEVGDFFSAEVVKARNYVANKWNSIDWNHRAGGVIFCSSDSNETRYYEPDKNTHADYVEKSDITGLLGLLEHGGDIFTKSFLGGIDFVNKIYEYRSSSSFSHKKGNDIDSQVQYTRLLRSGIYYPVRNPSSLPTVYFPNDITEIMIRRGDTTFTIAGPVAPNPYLPGDTILVFIKLNDRVIFKDITYKQDSTKVWKKKITVNEIHVSRKNQ